ncbi:MAG: carboxymuconolactone decarboxylase family protein [Alphaproteobacteria bacterium]|jgi:AhpD family alkylhydroperoxidase|nr:carboxymuconolactone decarboxylase family protein [Alphaproteobacteria bacterium]
MEQRLDLARTAPGIMTTMRKLTAHVHDGPIEQRLLELVMVRASQINGCAFCIAMHVRAAIEAGENAGRLHLLPAWREAPGFSPRERAALAWTEALTRLGEHGVPDEVYAAAVTEFGEAELAELSLAVVTINGWNRLMIAFRVPPRG